MAGVDDAGVVGVALQRRVHPRRRPGERIDEGRHQRRGAQHVVGRDAGLARVEQFAGGDPAGGVHHIATGVQDRGRLPAQLQRHRCQVGCRGDGDLAPDRGRAGEQQVIERQADELAADVGVAGHDRAFVGGEAACDQLLEQRRKARRELAGFDQHAVAGSQRGDRRAERQLQRVVPGTDDARHAQRLRHDPARARQGVQGRGDAARLHPAPQVLARMRDGAQHHDGFGDGGFMPRALAEVGRDRFGDRVFVGGHEKAQPRQPVEPYGAAGEAVPGERQPLRFEQGVQAQGRGAIHGGYQAGWCSRTASLTLEVRAKPGPYFAARLSARAKNASMPVP